MMEIVATMKQFIIVIVLLLALVPYTVSAQTVTITDMAGRKVLIPQQVHRIVALSASLRYIVYLQAFDMVVGIEGVEKQKSMQGINASGKPYWLAIAHTIDTIPDIGEGGPGKLPDFEKLIMVKPDVIFTFEPDNANLIQQKTKIPCVVCNYAGTEGFVIEDIKRTFVFLGNILNKKQRAVELNTYIDKCVADLSRRVSGVEKKKVYIGAVSARGAHTITSTESNYPPLEWIGAINVANKTGINGHAFINKENIIMWNPDYIFIDTGGLLLVENDYIKNKVFYQNLRAVKHGLVYTVFPYNFYRTNIEIMIANAYFMGKVLYPERFKDVIIRKKADEIFKRFIGINAYNELQKYYKGYGRVEFTEKGITIH